MTEAGDIKDIIERLLQNRADIDRLKRQIWIIKMEAVTVVIGWGIALLIIAVWSAK